jgi:hypothetical protein
MADYEQSRKNLETFLTSTLAKQQNRNEATTRLHIIDYLFFDCLGWSKDEMQSEEGYNQEYADYTFYAPRRMLVVEAKKEGQYFELPAGMESIEYPISSLIRDNKTV